MRARVLADKIRAGQSMLLLGTNRSPSDNNLASENSEIVFTSSTLPDALCKPSPNTTIRPELRLAHLALNSTTSHGSAYPPANQESKAPDALQPLQKSPTPLVLKEIFVVLHRGAAVHHSSFDLLGRTPYKRRGSFRQNHTRPETYRHKCTNCFWTSRTSASSAAGTRSTSCNGAPTRVPNSKE